MSEYLYQLRASALGIPWVDVTKDEWIKAERAAGFRPQLASSHPDYMKVCATGGFSSSGGIAGRIVPREFRAGQTLGPGDDAARALKQ